MTAAQYCRTTLGVAFCLVFIGGCQTSGVHTADARPTNAEAPKVGDEAPPLTLDTLDGKRSVKLAGFEHKKPVVLFFGSYT